MSDKSTAGVVDTNILILRASIDAIYLPETLAISAVTLAELSAGVVLVQGTDPESTRERARRLDLLQRVEREFDPLPFDADCARLYGRLAGSVAAAGRTPRRRVADLMIAATAAANDLPVYTTNPSDFAGLDDVVEIRSVPRPLIVSTDRQ